MVELDTEGEKTREGVAAFLREFADELDEPSAVAGDGTLEPKRITLIVGGDSATVTVPEMVDFEVEVESRSPMFASGVSQEIEFELSWDVEDPDEFTDELIEVE